MWTRVTSNWVGAGGGAKPRHCAKSLWGEAPCGSAVHGKVDEISPAHPQPPPPPPTPASNPPAPEPPCPWTPPSLHGRQGGQGRIDNITGRQGTLHCSCLEPCFLFQNGRCSSTGVERAWNEDVPVRGRGRLEARVRRAEATRRLARRVDAPPTGLHVGGLLQRTQRPL